MKTDNEREYRELMNSNPLVKLTPDYKGEIPHGCLIGFMGLGGDRGITATYQVWSFIKAKHEIQFVLFTNDDGRHVIDNTWLTSKDLYINEPPIVKELITTKMPTTFS